MNQKIWHFLHHWRKCRTIFIHCQNHCLDHLCKNFSYCLVTDEKLKISGNKHVWLMWFVESLCSWSVITQTNGLNGRNISDLFVLAGYSRSKCFRPQSPVLLGSTDLFSWLIPQTVWKNQMLLSQVLLDCFWSRNVHNNPPFVSCIPVSNVKFSTLTLFCKP